MNDFSASLIHAAQLLGSGDPRLWEVVALSLFVSGCASAVAVPAGLVAGAWLAVTQFPGRRAVLVVLNTLLALPSVVVGLVVYLLLSRAGPLGSLGLLFTPGAMIVAQSLLVLPIVTALARQMIEDQMRDHGEQLLSLGAGRLRCALLLLWDERMSLVTLALAAFGRAVSEVGAVMIVGGNIDGVTRVMTTAIALETSKGDLPLALALGFVLLGVVLILNAWIALLKEWRLRTEEAWT
ncbi:MAG: ABC transporter permease [Pseudomonadota bacterium]|uniref:ABC transporter permease n=1 Tax=Caldimonas aquatica TaxID=376175 RepID=A0ABY6MV12_9BURK|nr:ABC transporter permease [Schlegelella aquatica]UZD55857.1 ABC transporter permease [Schlegelella aquatica]